MKKNILTGGLMAALLSACSGGGGSNAVTPSIGQASTTGQVYHAADIPTSKSPAICAGSPKPSPSATAIVPAVTQQQNYDQCHSLSEVPIPSGPTDADYTKNVRLNYNGAREAITYNDGSQFPYVDLPVSYFIGDPYGYGSMNIQLRNPNGKKSKATVYLTDAYRSSLLAPSYDENAYDPTPDEYGFGITSCTVEYVDSVSFNFALGVPNGGTMHIVDANGAFNFSFGLYTRIPQPPYPGAPSVLDTPTPSPAGA